MNEHTYLHVHDNPPEYDWAKIQRARQIKEDATELLRYENAQPAVCRQLLFGVVLFVLCLVFLVWAAWDDYQFKNFMREQARYCCTQRTLVCNTAGSYSSNCTTKSSSNKHVCCYITFHSFTEPRRVPKRISMLAMLDSLTATELFPTWSRRRTSKTALAVGLACSGKLSMST